MLGGPLCGMLKIRYPIFQGAMAWISPAPLAAAVSEAGGLGIIGAGNQPASWLKDQIADIKSRTRNPFGVNVMLLSPHVEEIMQLIQQERVPVVTTGAGNPGKYVNMLKAAGTRIFPVVSSVALARRLERLGVDGVIAEGMESGGHVGEVSTLSLIPQVVDAVKIPVIAAGGIADGRGLVAAMALGASGVQLGTRFIVARECPAHPAYKQAIILAGDRDTVVTGTTTGHPVRVLKNRFARELQEMERRGAVKEEIEKFGEGKYPAAALKGDLENGSIMAGQIAGLVRKEQTAAEIIGEIIDEAYDLIEKIAGWGRDRV